MTDAEDRSAAKEKPATDEGKMPDLERRAIIGRLAGLAAGTSVLVTVLLESRSEAS
jgi:hypothetical protein